MRSLIRAGAVLAAVAFCAPALACSDMQTTAQQATEQQPAVAKAQPMQSQQTRQTVKKTAKAQPKVAKTHGQKVAAK